MRLIKDKELSDEKAEGFNSSEVRCADMCEIDRLIDELGWFQFLRGKVRRERNIEGS